MYVNPLHRVSGHHVLFALMASHPLGAWVCHGRTGLVANHVPFLLDRSRGPYGTLIGHVSRANTVWRELGSTVCETLDPLPPHTAFEQHLHAMHPRKIAFWTQVACIGGTSDIDDPPEP